MKLLRFIMAVTVISFVSCRDISEKLSAENNNDTELNEDTDSPNITMDSQVEETPEEIPDTNQITTENQVSTEEIVAETTEETKETLSPGEFYIIAGSFKDFKKAENLYKELSAKGYTDSKILDPVNNFSRVVIRSFNNEEMARAELKKLRKQFGDESIWLFKP